MKDPDDFNAEDAVRAYLSRLPAERERQHCHLCGERYLLENLEDCAGCKEDTCYECGARRKNPATGESECVCNACLEYRAGWWNEGKPPKTLTNVFIP